MRRIDPGLNSKPFRLPFEGQMLADWMEIDLARAHPGSHSRYDKKKKILYKEFVSKGLEEFKHSTGDSKVTKRLTQLLSLPHLCYPLSQG